MALKVAIRLSIIAVLAVLALGTACGLKSHPEPYSKLAPKAVDKVAVRPTKAGMEVSFVIPDPDREERTVVEVMVYYAYRPLSAKLPCGKCPIILKQFRSVKVGKDKDGKIRGGGFAFIDTAAPIGKMCVYQVVVVDVTGKKSDFSNWAAAPRLDPPATPAGFKAEPRNESAILTWQPVDKLLSGAPAAGLAGYLVYRQDGKKAVPVTEKPLKAAKYLARELVNGKPYQYQVRALRMVGKHQVMSAPTAWVAVTPADVKPPDPPKDIVTVSAPAGLYLRFTASPSDDVAGYLIFRKQGAGDWVQLNKEPVSEQAYIDKSAQKGVTYQYRAVAVDRGGNRSQPSAPATATHQP